MELSVLFAVISVVSATKKVNYEVPYVYSTQQFSVRAYQELKTELPGNFLLSPLCLQSLLALKHAGAKDQTAEELAASLFLPTHQVQDVYTTVLASDKTNKNYQLNLSHKIFVQGDYQILENFRRNAREHYNASIEFLNFTGDAVTRLHHHLPNEHSRSFLTANSLDHQSVFLISNLEFQCTFYLDCPGYKKSKRPFHLTERRSKEIDMTQFRGMYYYYESTELNAKFLELPFHNDESVVTVALPNKIDGLAALEERLSEVMEQKNFAKRAITVEIPDFVYTTRIPVKELLRRMGIRRTFDPHTADFRGISERDSIYFSDLFMRASFNLSFPRELSTEQLVDLYTSVHRGSCPSNDRTVEFTMNHPYIFTVSVKKSGSILFLGRVTHPEIQYL